MAYIASAFTTGLLVCFLVAANEENGLLVRTPSGSFKGTVLTSLQGWEFKAFRGIPFALPPVGNLRFAKPQPHPVIDGIYNATEFGPRCIQAKEVSHKTPGQEDCLYLNVFVPVENSEENEKEIKKVFVYIYGGAAYTGAANEHVPGDFVAQGDIIVVTFNYRLSWLGGLKGNSSELPGNLDTWDQLLALQWVKDNIRSFGGDPDDVTIGGESMGSLSVSKLSITSYGKGLFTKGILMSGTIFTSQVAPGTSDSLLHTLAEKFDCYHGNEEDIVKCLRAVPEEKYSLPFEMSAIRKFTAIDGDLFPRAIADLVSDREYLEKVGYFSRNYLVSLTNNEGPINIHGIFAVKGAAPDKVDLEFLSKWLQTPPTISEKIMAWYEDSQNYVTKPGYDLMMDVVFSSAAFKFLETFVSGSKHVERNSSCYLLWFDFTPSYMPEQLQGFFHALDLNYVFDLDPAFLLDFYYQFETDKPFSESDWQLKDRYIQVLSDFIKTGNPGTNLAEELNLTWPPFDFDKESYLAFEPEPRVKQRLLEGRRHFWKYVLPKYIEDLHKSEAERKEEL